MPSTCRACSAPLTAGSRFCTSCGKAVAASTPTIPAGAPPTALWREQSPGWSPARPIGTAPERILGAIGLLVLAVGFLVIAGRQAYVARSFQDLSEALRQQHNLGALADQLELVLLAGALTGLGVALIRGVRAALAPAAIFCLGIGVGGIRGRYGLYLGTPAAGVALGLVALLVAVLLAVSGLARMQRTPAGTAETGRAAVRVTALLLGVILLVPGINNLAAYTAGDLVRESAAYGGVQLRYLAFATLQTAGALICLVASGPLRRRTPFAAVALTVGLLVLIAALLIDPRQLLAGGLRAGGLLSFTDYLELVVALGALVVLWAAPSARAVTWSRDPAVPRGAAQFVAFGATAVICLAAVGGGIPFGAHVHHEITSVFGDQAAETPSPADTPPPVDSPTDTPGDTTTASSNSWTYDEADDEGATIGTVTIATGELTPATQGITNGSATLGDGCTLGDGDAAIPFEITFDNSTTEQQDMLFDLSGLGDNSFPDLDQTELSAEYDYADGEDCESDTESGTHSSVAPGGSSVVYGFFIISGYEDLDSSDAASAQDEATITIEADSASSDGYERILSYASGGSQLSLDAGSEINLLGLEPGSGGE